MTPILNVFDFGVSFFKMSRTSTLWWPYSSCSTSFFIYIQIIVQRCYRERVGMLRISIVKSWKWYETDSDGRNLWYHLKTWNLPGTADLAFLSHKTTHQWLKRQRNTTRVQLRKYKHKGHTCANDWVNTLWITSPSNETVRNKSRTGG